METSSIQIFTNENLGQIRTVTLNGDPWFVAADICGILDIKNPTVAMNGLEDFERAKLNIGMPYGEVNIVSESGFYSMVVRSRKEAAKPFRIWVTSEVLPSIRKTGKYELPQVQAPQDIDCSTEFLEMTQKYDKLYEDMGKMAQLVIDIHDKLMSKELPREEILPDTGSMYEAWKASVYENVEVLKNNGEFDSKKDALKSIYGRMNRDYGVCWDQELIDYRNKYNISGRIYTLDIIWDKEILRSIFNGILGGMIQNVARRDKDIEFEATADKRYGDCDLIIRPLVEKRSDSSNHGCATFRLVYHKMDEMGDINWKRAENHYINKYGMRGMTRKLIVESSPTLMKKFKDSVRVMMSE